MGSFQFLHAGVLPLPEIFAIVVVDVAICNLMLISEALRYICICIVFYLEQTTSLQILPFLIYLHTRRRNIVVLYRLPQKKVADRILRAMLEDKILDHFGPARLSWNLWANLGHFEPLWTSLGHFGTETWLPNMALKIPLPTFLGHPRISFLG